VVGTVPVLDDDGSSRNFGTQCDGGVIPVLFEEAKLVSCAYALECYSSFVLSVLLPAARTEMVERDKTYIPSNSESQGIINITGTELRDGTREGEPSGHLTQALHHGKDRDTSEGVAEQD
jgi:hypothetical protein